MIQYLLNKLLAFKFYTDKLLSTFQGSAPSNSRPIILENNLKNHVRIQTKMMAFILILKLSFFT